MSLIWKLLSPEIPYFTLDFIHTHTHTHTHIHIYAGKDWLSKQRTFCQIWPGRWLWSNKQNFLHCHPRHKKFSRYFLVVWGCPPALFPRQINLLMQSTVPWLLFLYWYLSVFFPKPVRRPFDKLIYTNIILSNNYRGICIFNRRVLICNASP